MPTFYRYIQNGLTYSFDDVFVPADAFRQGNLWAWGRNTQGQFGNNSISASYTPVTTFLAVPNWKQIACGPQHSAAIKTDGTLWTWARNDLATLGDNTTTDKLTPITTFAGGTNWKQVSSKGQYTAAIKTDGTLWTWGQNTYGQLGDNTITARSTPVTTFAGGTNWKQVACGYRHTLAIKTDGTLWGWGGDFFNTGQLGDNTTTNRSTPVTTFAGGNNWKQVACGSYHTAAIKTDGTLWTWGSNSNGELGINNVSQRNFAVTTFAGGNNWKQVACGSNYTAAIKTDGTLWVWGGNGISQLGDNTSTNRSTPVTTFAGGTNWKQVSSGTIHTAAVKTDGTLWTWGYNADGQLGINVVGGYVTTPVTTFLGRTNWKQVACGDGFISAVTYIDDYV